MFAAFLFCRILEISNSRRARREQRLLDHPEISHHRFANTRERDERKVQFQRKADKAFSVSRIENSFVKI
jgi:hypothetical protein